MIRDVLGREFTFADPPRRVVSLVPSLTETLFDLNVGSTVVGVTNYCIFPEGITAARVGGTKNPDVEAIRRLEPDLVHVNLEENLQRHAEAIEKVAPVFASEPKRVEDVIDLFAVLGQIHGCGEQAARLIRDCELELADHYSRRFTFVCPIWKRPWMWCGGDTYVSSLIEAVGGRNLLADRLRYPSIELEEVLALEPEVIFLPDEPFAFTNEDAEEVSRESRARIVGPFAGDLFTWHGSRTIQGLRFLRGLTL